MFTLFHHPFCPHSRFIRLVTGELGLETRLVEERVWERREAFLALNPAAATPVLIAEGRRAVPGPSIIAEYLDETHREPPLLPADPLGRARVRALALDIACEIHPLNNLRVLRYLVKEMALSEEQKKTQGFQIKSNTYFRITPVFDAPVGPHDWLTRTVIVGRGRRLPDPDHTVFDYYAVR